MADTKFVEVYRAENSIDAHLIKDALGDAGISAQITEESTASMRPNLWWACPKLLVAETDAEKATAIIREIETARAARSNSDNAD
jgi:signal recognition particle subunit SEC65